MKNRPNEPLTNTRQNRENKKPRPVFHKTITGMAFGHSPSCRIPPSGIVALTPSLFFRGRFGGPGFLFPETFRSCSCFFLLAASTIRPTQSGFLFAFLPFCSPPPDSLPSLSPSFSLLLSPWSSVCAGSLSSSLASEAPSG